MNTNYFSAASATNGCAEDAELAAALEAYLTSLEAGSAPPIDELLQAHPNIATAR